MVDMKQIAGWRRERAQLNGERDTLTKAAGARVPQAFNDTERERLAAIRAEITRLTELIEAAEEAGEAERGVLSARPGEAPAGGGAGVFDPRGTLGGDGPRQTNPFGPRPNPFQADPLLAGPLHIAGETFRGVGDWLQAEARTALARVKPHEVSEGDPRILRIMSQAQAQALPPGAGASGGGRPAGDPLLAGDGLDASIPTAGGVFLQRQVMAHLLARAWGEGQILSRCTTIPVGAGFDGVYLPTLEENDRTRGKRHGGIQLFWKGETPPDHKLRAEPRSIELGELRGFILVDDKTLRDAAVLGAYIIGNFPKAFTWEAEDMVLRGNGVGRPLGIFDKANAGKIVVAKEANQAAETVEAKNLIKLRGGCLDIGTAAFFVNAEVDEQLMLAHLPTGANSGQLVYMPPSGLSGSPYGTIFGRPVIPIEQASGLGELGDIGLYDFSQYVFILRDGGLETGVSLEFAFDVWQKAWRFRLECNGQPVYRQPIKPAYGKRERSPFAVLADRK